MPAGAVGTCWAPGAWPDTAWEAGAWGGGIEPSPPGRLVCLTGRDRAVTSATGVDGASAPVQGRDRAVTTVTVDLDC